MTPVLSRASTASLAAVPQARQQLAARAASALRCSVVCWSAVLGPLEVGGVRLLRTTTAPIFVCGWGRVSP